MKHVLLDEGIAPAVAGYLRDAVDIAGSSGRVCVTLDHDFHTHLAIARAGRPSVVLLRIQGLDASGQARLIRAVWQSCEEALEAGAAVSADTTTVRIRRLPLK